MHHRIFIYLFLFLCTYQLTVAMQNNIPVHVIERTQVLSTDEQVLLVAAAAGDIGMITLCLNAGARVDCIGDQKVTPLMEAAQEGHLDAVKLLLHSKASVNAQVEGGIMDTALHCAVANNHVPITKMLLAARANITLQDNTLETVLHLVAYNGYQEIINELLLEIPVHEHEPIRNCFTGVCIFHLNRIRWMHENGQAREFPLDLRKLLIRYLIRTNAQEQMQRNVSLIRCRNYRKKTASDIARKKSVRSSKAVLNAC